ncbi:hypothetical protein GCM10009603_05020 [Nocardiopsis exhalans]
MGNPYGRWNSTSSEVHGGSGLRPRDAIGRGQGAGGLEFPNRIVGGITEGAIGSPRTDGVAEVDELVL